jgi:hypothetical protein
MAQASRTVENIVWLESLLPSESALYDSLSSLVASCMTLRLITPCVCYEHRLYRLDACLGGAALAHTGLSFVPSGPASSSFLL